MKADVTIKEKKRASNIQDIIISSPGTIATVGLPLSRTQPRTICSDIKGIASEPAESITIQPPTPLTFLTSSRAAIPASNAEYPAKSMTSATRPIRSKTWQIYWDRARARRSSGQGSVTRVNRAVMRLDRDYSKS